MRATIASNQAQELANLTGNVYLFYEVVGHPIPGTYTTVPAPLYNGLQARKAVVYTTGDGMILDAIAVPPERETTLIGQYLFDFARDLQGDITDQLEYLTDVISNDRLGVARHGEDTAIDKLIAVRDSLAGLEAHIRKNTCEDLVVRSGKVQKILPR